jgi:hypothetical protein
MRSFAACTIVALLWPLSAHAVCVKEPLEPKLRDANVVYVGTVVQSELTGPLPSADIAESPRQRRVEVRHTLQPEIVLKGDPALAPSVLSAWQYNPPKSKRTVKFAELSAVLPGDTLLVVARSGEPTYLSLCSPTREWNAETARMVHAVFPAAP